MLIKMVLSENISRKFKFWSFVSMVLLVFVHGYNLDIRYMQPWTNPGEPLTVTGFTEYFLANGLFRFRIPMLFIISGFLYALHDQKPNRERIRKRLRTLLLPYVLWSAIGLIFTFLLELNPVSRSLVADSQILKIDSNRVLLHDYYWYEWLWRWLLVPIPYQLWFIRVLLVYNLAYSAIRWCVTNSKARWVYFGICILMWLGTMGFGFFEGEGLLFFSLGVLIQKTGYSIESERKNIKPGWWGLGFIVLAALKTFLAFKGQSMLGNSIYPVLTILHKLVILSGLIACWYGLDKVVRWFMNMPWFAWVSAFSFIIYAVHAPLVAYLINPVLLLFKGIPGGQLLAFVLLPLCIIAFSIGMGYALRRLSPNTYSLLTGGRGI